MLLRPAQGGTAGLTGTASRACFPRTKFILETALGVTQTQASGSVESPVEWSWGGSIPSLLVTLTCPSAVPPLSQTAPQLARGFSSLIVSAEPVSTCLRSPLGSGSGAQWPDKWHWVQTETHFYCEGGWTTEEVTQRGCEASVHGDTQTLTTRGSIQPALADPTQAGAGLGNLQSPFQPQPCCDSLHFVLISSIKHRYFQVFHQFCPRYRKCGFQAQRHIEPLPNPWGWSFRSGLTT